MRSLVVVLGAVHVWAAISAYSMNEDGINYLDIGDAYFKGDWNSAINSVWSPMYSWILGLVMHLLKPSMHWEFPAVHLTNFLIYMFAFICFEVFWSQIMRYRASEITPNPDNRFIALPDWALWMLGYLIFIIASLQLIEIWAVTPDMLMSAFVYLSAGIILRIRLDSLNFITFILLGITLGLGFLSKAIMFPLAFFFFGVSLFSGKNFRRQVPLTITALVVFLMISSPFIALVSYAKGKFTLSSAGKLTYAKHVNHVQYPHWQGDPPGNGTPEHPSRKVFNSPPIYEFGSPIGGTYPISHDPSYWYEGIISKFNLKNQFNYLITSSLYYYDLFFNKFGGLVFGIFVLYFLSTWKSLRVSDLISKWGLIIPAAVAFGFYALVNVIGRYIGVFVVLFWSDLLINVRLRDTQFTRQLMPFLSVLMIAFLSVNIVAFNFEGYRALSGSKSTRNSTVSEARSPSWPGEVAEELHRLNIVPGDEVAVIGYAFDSYWARLARLKIVAEMFGWEADPFWLGEKSFQSQVIDVFKRTGAKVIVAEDVPGYARLKDWHQVNDTNYFIYLLGS